MRYKIKFTAYANDGSKIRHALATVTKENKLFAQVAVEKDLRKRHDNFGYIIVHSINEDSDSFNDLLKIFGM